jgi:hypothetical protein
MSGIDVLNVSVGVISLVLGGFAIWLSVYFFMKAKDSEKEAAMTLEAIRVQTDALQKLTGRWMDRLTRYATEPRPADEGLMMLVNTMANLPTTILTHLRVHTATEAAPSNEALIAEMVDCYIALYYYIAIANVSTQPILPNNDVFDNAVPEHVGIRRVVDQTSTDFDYIARILAGVNESRLKASRVRHLLDEAKVSWRPLVRNADGVWESRRS